MDIADLSLISGITVEHAQTTIEGEVRGYLAGSTNLYTIIVLASLHISVHVVACCTKGSQHSCDVAHYTLERAETVAELTAATTTGY